MNLPPVGGLILPPYSGYNGPSRIINRDFAQQLAGQIGMTVDEFLNTFIRYSGRYQRAADNINSVFGASLYPPLTADEAQQISALYGLPQTSANVDLGGPSRISGGMTLPPVSGPSITLPPVSGFGGLPQVGSLDLGGPSRISGPSITLPPVFGGLPQVGSSLVHGSMYTPEERASDYNFIEYLADEAGMPPEDFLSTFIDPAENINDLTNLLNTTFNEALDSPLTVDEVRKIKDTFGGPVYQPPRFKPSNRITPSVRLPSASVTDCYYITSPSEENRQYIQRLARNADMTELQFVIHMVRIYYGSRLSLDDIMMYNLEFIMDAFNRKPSEAEFERIAQIAASYK